MSPYFLFIEKIDLIASYKTIAFELGSLVMLLAIVFTNTTFNIVYSVKNIV